MKKSLSLLLSLATLGSMSSVAFADIAPSPGEKDIPACSMIDNLKDFPNVAFIAAEYGFNTDSMGIELLNDQSCISNTKWSGKELFAIDKKDIGEYITAAPIPNQPLFDPAKPKDPRTDINAYQVPKDSPQFSEYGYNRVSTAEADRTQYDHKIYHIIGFDNSSKTISLALVEEKTAVSDQKFGYDGIVDNLYSKDIKTDTSIFTDVKTDNNYATPVLFLKRNGYVKGYDDGSYKPGQTINRAEFTKIVMKDFTSTKTYDCSKQIFKDVSIDSKNWYRDYVCKAFNEGIIMGYPDNTFRPEQPITFAEAAKIMLKVKGFQTEGVTEPWYKEFTDYFQSKNILPTTIKSHEKLITRGDMALLIRSIIDPLFYSGKSASIIDPLFYVDNKSIIDPLF